MRPYELTLTAAHAVRNRELSPAELVDSVLARLAEVEPGLGAHVTVTANRAREPPGTTCGPSAPAPSWRREWLRLLDAVDVLAAPAVPLTAVPAEQDSVTWPDGATESLSDAYACLPAPGDITGVPSLTVPVGRDRPGLPIGMRSWAARSRKTRCSAPGTPTSGRSLLRERESR